MLGPDGPTRKPPLATLVVLANSMKEPLFRFLVVATATLVFISAVIMRIFDHKEYGSIGVALWWAVQTVTTVGYGDVTPVHPIGRIVAALLMIVAIGFLAILTSTIASNLVIDDPETKRRAEDVHAALARIEARLDRIEAAGKTD
jgi:voltage-gated potassium channel